MARTAKVGFDTTVKSRRAPREDETSVMRVFARHARSCEQCDNPYRTFQQGGELCHQGHLYARDVAKYIYSKGGAPFSLIDRDSFGERNEIEIPVDCEVIRNLIKAFDRGLSLRSKKPIISHDPNYYVKDRKERRYYDNDRGYGAEIVPASSKSRRERERQHYYKDGKDRPRTTTVQDPRGSLYYFDEEAKQSRKRYDEDPVVIIAEPRRRVKK